MPPSPSQEQPMGDLESWRRFRLLHFHDAETGFSLDLSRMGLPDSWEAGMEKRLHRAFRDMAALEAGALANPAERRMVGHYWLRDPDLAPRPELGQAIRSTQRDVLALASAVHQGRMAPPGQARFTGVLSLGIGGSALGPRFVAEALAPVIPPLWIRFIDNTDPDGMERVLAVIGEELPSTLVLMISKSGTTPEPRNACLEVEAALRALGLPLAPRAVAITGEGSQLDQTARDQGWLARFPMWDWVGGRTSEFSAVGLLPAALQGVPVSELVAGGATMDRITRRPHLRENPAALLASAWYCATGGHGTKDMVVLPYKDRLELFPRYLQQLVMESLGKEVDRNGRPVHQGLTVYGNKGSTDQHALVQQLRDGLPNFFATFIEVLRDREGPPLEVEPGITSGDYLAGFLQGTRKALSERGRPVMTLTLPDLSARSVGALIALYERAVGLYASLVNINAYDQPGVEAGKKAAADVLELQRDLLGVLEQAEEALSVEEIAQGCGTQDLESLFLTLRHLAANRTELVVEGEDASPFSWRYRRRKKSP